MSQIYSYNSDIKSKGIWESAMVKAHSSVVFSEIDGPGIIKKLWLTTFPGNDEENIEFADKVFLKIYWEGSENAAVTVPLSDFFCQSLRLQPIENHFFQSPSNQVLFNTTIPMPFRRFAKLEVMSTLDREFELFFGIDIEFKEVDQNAMYLHTHWQSQKDLPSDQPFELLPEIKGCGRYLGTHLSVFQRKSFESWPWYTRPISVKLDSELAEDEPTLYIKTIDDYFGSAWWDREPNHDTYTYQHFGRPLVDIDKDGNLKISLYKYHIQDSLWFHNNIKIEIGNNWNWGNQAIETGDWKSTCFIYLREPVLE